MIIHSLTRIDDKLVVTCMDYDASTYKVMLDVESLSQLARKAKRSNGGKVREANGALQITWMPSEQEAASLRIARSRVATIRDLLAGDRKGNRDSFIDLGDQRLPITECRMFNGHIEVRVRPEDRTRDFSRWIQVTGSEQISCVERQSEVAS